MRKALIYAQLHINRAVWAMNDDCNGRKYDPAVNNGLTRERYISLQIKEATDELRKAAKEYPHQISLVTYLEEGVT